jgi:hypothetical protein
MALMMGSDPSHKICKTTPCTVEIGLSRRDRRAEKMEDIVKSYRAERDAGPQEDDGEGEPAEAPAEEPVTEPKNDPELELQVYGERYKIRRSKLIEEFNLEGLPDHVIVSVAQKEMAADQRLARVKEREAENPPHGSEPGRTEAPAPGAPLADKPTARADEPDADGFESDRSPDGQNQPLAPEKLAEIVERIQIGDTARLSLRRAL